MKFSSAISFLLVGSAASFAPAPATQRSSSVSDTTLIKSNLLAMEEYTLEMHPLYYFSFAFIIFSIEDT
jgi:hypothetical protein